MTATLRQQIEENDVALRAARSQPRSGAGDLEIHHLELQRAALIDRALRTRDPESMSWLAVHGGGQNAEQAAHNTEE